jgi:flagellin-like hook-associated protein FlgL
MRSNLLSLQGTVDLLNRTQNRLSSGKKVNTAIDNPVSFFASQALTARASSIDALKDGMGQAIQTIQAADKGIKAITAMIEQAKGIAQAGLSAAAGTGFNSETVTLNSVAISQNITIGAVTLTAGPTAVVTAYTNFTMTIAGVDPTDTVKVGGVTFTATGGATTIATEFNSVGADDVVATALQSKIASYFGTGLGSAVNGATVTITAGTMSLGASTVETGLADPGEIAIASHTTTSAGALSAIEFAWTGDDDSDAQALANLINNNATLDTAGYKATAAAGVITLTNSLADIAVGDVTGTAITAGTMVEVAVSADAELSTLVTRYNTMRTQIDELADDAGYKGKNLLANDSLVVQFEGTTLSVAGFNAKVAPADLNITAAAWLTTGSGGIDADILELDAALSTLRQESSKLSGNLSIIVVRNDFSTNLINTLIEGSDKLTLADSNEEGANMLMLQTRQTLATTALSLSAQAAQSVLRLFQ